MKQTITKSFIKMMACQLDNTPNADDLDMVIEVYTEALSGMTELQVGRRFELWMYHNSRWPTPSNIRNMRTTDYSPTLDIGKPAISNDSRRLPLKSETVSSAEYAAEWLNKIKEHIR